MTDKCGECKAPAIYYANQSSLGFCGECFLEHVVPEPAGTWRFIPL